MIYINVSLFLFLLTQSFGPMDNLEEYYLVFSLSLMIFHLVISSVVEREHVVGAYTFKMAKSSW